MDKNLLNRYRQYTNTEDAFAILFVKQHLIQSKGHWIDISNSRRYEMSSDNLHFRFVTGGLYKRKVHPQYPPKSAFTINGVSLDIENYCTLRLFFDLSTLAGLSRRNLPEAGIRLLFQI